MGSITPSSSLLNTNKEIMEEVKMPKVEKMKELTLTYEEWESVVDFKYTVEYLPYQNSYIHTVHERYADDTDNYLYMKADKDDGIMDKDYYFYAVDFLNQKRKEREEV